MQISAEQMADFATALRAADRQLPHDDRRRTPRLDVRSRVAVTLIKDGQRLPTQFIRLKDLSPRGVSLLHTQPINRGEQFIITLPRDNSDPVTILCTAVYCKTIAGRLAMIGAEFTCTAAQMPAKPAAPSPTAQADEERIRKSMFE